MSIILEESGTDLFSIHHEYILNPCNCVGVARAGLSLILKRKYPYAYESYRRLCENGYLKPGMVYFSWNAPWREAPKPQDPHYIVQFPTKNHWENPSKLDFISSGMDAFTYQLRFVSDTPGSIAIPALGSGLRRIKLG